MEETTRQAVENLEESERGLALKLVLGQKKYLEAILVLMSIANVTSVLDIEKQIKEADALIALLG